MTSTTVPTAISRARRAPSSLQSLRLPPTCLFTPTRAITINHFSTRTPNPQISPRCLRSPQLLSRRPFSSTSVAKKDSQPRMPRMGGGTTARVGAQKSQTLAQQEAQDNVFSAEDKLLMMGMLPDTWIVPTSKEMIPSWWAAPRERLNFEWRRWSFAVKVIFGNRGMAWIQHTPRLRMNDIKALDPKMKDPSGVLGFPARMLRLARINSELADGAQKLHLDMLAAFAKGETAVAAMETKLAPGLQASLKKRFRERARDRRYDWRLEKILTEPKLVNFRLAFTPLKAGVKMDKARQNGLCQAVVRIRTKQSLIVYMKKRGGGGGGGRYGGKMEEVAINSKGEELTAEGAEERRKLTAKETTEYVVLQRAVSDGVWGDWRLWGTTRESRLEEYLKARAQQEEFARYQGLLLKEQGAMNV